jgi:hypothetical protein
MADLSNLIVGSRQKPSVVTNVVLDERGDEVVAVIVARLHTHSRRNAGRGTRSLHRSNDDDDARGRDAMLARTTLQRRTQRPHTCSFSGCSWPDFRNWSSSP